LDDFPVLIGWSFSAVCHILLSAPVCEQLILMPAGT